MKQFNLTPPISLEARKNERPRKDINETSEGRRPDYTFYTLTFQELAWSPCSTSQTHSFIWVSKVKTYIIINSHLYLYEKSLYLKLSLVRLNSCKLSYLLSCPEDNKNVSGNHITKNHVMQELGVLNLQPFYNTLFTDIIPLCSLRERKLILPFVLTQLRYIPMYPHHTSLIIRIAPSSRYISWH